MIIVSTSKLSPEHEAYWVEAASLRGAQVATCDCHGELHPIGATACVLSDGEGFSTPRPDRAEDGR